jgi:hypothetical protein
MQPPAPAPPAGSPKAPDDLIAAEEIERDE